MQIWRHPKLVIRKSGVTKTSRGENAQVLHFSNETHFARYSRLIYFKKHIFLANIYVRISDWGSVNINYHCYINKIFIQK